MRHLIVGLLAASVSLFGDDLGPVDVEGHLPASASSALFESAEYLERTEYVDKAPAQKRLGISEAMALPGVQGDPVKALRTLGGVTTLGDNSGELYIYGSKPEESITTLNHLPLGYLYHMSGIHSVLSPDLIEQIDAYLGGFDVTYGNAMGGVIDVTPRFTGSEDAGMAHMGIYDASASIERRLDERWGIYFGARRSYFDLALDAAGQTTGTLSKKEKLTYTQFPNYYDMNLFLTYRHDGANLFSLEGIAAHDALQINTQSNAVKDPLATGEIGLERGFATLGLRWQYEDGLTSANTLLYRMESTTQNRLFDGYTIDLDVTLDGVYHQTTHHAGDHRLTAGFEFQHSRVPLDINASVPPVPEDVDFDFTSAEKYQIKREVRTMAYALFFQDVYALSEQITLRGGVRLGGSDYQDFGYYADPRGAIVYVGPDGHSLSFSAGRYTQYPEGYKSAEPMGSKTVHAQHAWHYLLHYGYADSRGWELGVEPFYKSFEELAVSDASKGFSNSAGGYAYGVDMNAKYRRGDWYGYVAYTYLYSRRQISAEESTQYRFYGEVPHTLQCLAAWRFAPEWSLSGLMQYHSGKPYTDIIGTYTDPADGRIRPLFGDPFSERLDDYYTLNLKIAQTRRWQASSLEWSFELMNATNHTNVSGIRYDDQYNREGEYTQLPLLPWIDITYRF